MFLDTTGISQGFPSLITAERPLQGFNIKKFLRHSDERDEMFVYKGNLKSL